VRAHAVANGSGDDEAIAFSDQMLGDLAMAEGDLDKAAALLVPGPVPKVAGRRRRRLQRIDLARVRLAQSRLGRLSPSPVRRWLTSVAGRTREVWRAP
jgi:hypothetical protein